MNYFIYPMKNMRITQSYNGTTSHKLHWYNVKDYKDYPIDEAGLNTSREGIYCPCDSMKVTAIKGVGNSKVTNTIWLVSTNKVQTPTFNDYAFMTLTHSNDSDFKNIKVGTIFKRGDLIVHEGENVNVATHIHMSFGRGNSNTWIKNSNGKYVMKGNTLKPEEVCYIDANFTKVINSGGITFKKLPTTIGNPTDRNENKLQIKVNVDNLRVRDNPSGNILGYIKKGIYDVIDTQEKNDYTWYKTNYGWIAYDKSWAVVLPKKEEVKNEKEQKEIKEDKKEDGKQQNVENSDSKNPNIELEIEPNYEKNESKKSILQIIIDFFKNLFK